jgi:hypothetical protein
MLSLLAACSGSSAPDLIVAPKASPGNDGAPGSSGMPGKPSGSSGEGSSGSSGFSGGSSGDSGTIATPDASVPADAGAVVAKDAGGGRSCSATTNCRSGEFCDAPDCSSLGVCRPSLLESDVLNPVCGCNGITYWNASLAQGAAVITAHAGACGGADANLKKCDSISGCPGPDGRLNCQFEVAQPTFAGACSLIKGGLCWQLPRVCPSAAGPVARVHACASGGACRGLCQAIEREEAYYFGEVCTP